MSDLVLAVDLGASMLRTGIVDGKGQVLDRYVEPTAKGVKARGQLAGAVAAVCEQHHPSRAVVGYPGRVDYANGRAEVAPLLDPAWTPLMTEEWLADLFGLPVSLANDADLATVGEAVFGAGGGAGSVAYVTISTGLASGVIRNGRLVRGDRSTANIAHTVIDATAAAEGRPATVEELGSGSALERRAREFGLPGGPQLVALLEDPRARYVWDETMRYAALGIVNLAILAMPDVLVIGGGVGRNWELVEPPIRAALERYGPEGMVDAIAVRPAALGDDSGLAGAAAWASAI